MKYIIIAILFFTIGCATSITSLMRFQDREMLFHPDKPATLAYPHNYEDCVDRRGILRVFGKKCKSKHKIDEYDLNNPEVWRIFVEGVWTCKNPMRFQY